MEKRPQTVAMAVVILMTAVWLMGFPAIACPADGKVCGDCIRDRMKLDCPDCAPVLRCMAQCLWSGDSRSRCMKRCDCDGATPRPKLSVCKRCMSRCKCSCTSSGK